MTVVLAAFSDAERAVADLAAGLGTVGTETPPDLQDHLPFIQPVRIGGDDNRITDRARLDVHVYAANATTAKAVAETVRQRLVSGPAQTTHGLIDRTVTESGPQLLPVTDQNIRHVVVTYRLSLRRPA